MIQFFKSQVYLEIEEDYSEVMEDIKLLKENYMLIKDSFDAPSGFFREIATKLYDKLEGAESVQAAINLIPEAQRSQFLENFTDTLIYERVGSYLLKSLVNIY